MQSINSSLNNLTLATGNNVAISPANVKNRVNPFAAQSDKPEKVTQALDNQKQAQQNQANQSQQKQSFELDEATIAFLESNQEQNQLVQKNDSSAFNRSNNSSNDFVAKDQVSSQNQTRFQVIKILTT